MNTPAKPALKLSAKYLGPVLALDGDLAPKTRNLIFARNGTGKSFLSRAFRYLDLHVQAKPLTDAARNLVSDEAADGRGEFIVAQGAVSLGSLKLDKTGELAAASTQDTIFHVFSEDFVQEELREQQFQLDGKTENQIAIDSNNIKLTNATKDLAEARAKEEKERSNLGLQLDAGKSTDLAQRAAIKKTLKEYTELSLDSLLEQFRTKPSAPIRASSEIFSDLDALKSIPSAPDSPQSVGPLQIQYLDLTALSELQKKITSPSSVAEAIKSKINKHPDFFRTGTEIIARDAPSTCPFCEQNVSTPGPKAIIDAYVRYFEDEEQRHKDELRSVYRALDRVESDLKSTERSLLVQKSRYDDLNRVFPSRKHDQLEAFEPVSNCIRAAAQTLKDGLKSKADNLSLPGPVPDASLPVRAQELNDLISKNNRYVAELIQAVHNSDTERKRLQREMCKTFSYEFASQHWNEIDALRKAQAEVRACEEEVAALERLRPSANSKARTAETFELLLKSFFATKYVFDKDEFTLKRGQNEMARGAHRTMSDGEKSAIAFCYFVASIHHKVKNNSDYRKLFLVFDDPVTSMSYDYVFAIAQTLKALAISDDGEVSLEADKGGKRYFGPNLLILTHSSYFFNISVSNKVVDPSAAFALHPEEAAHKLAPLNRYIAPFNEHLRDIWAVSNGTRKPDHSTGNAIRSVLEAIGRFCRPDKSKDLTAFIQHLTCDCGFTVKSVLINSLSHGTYYEEVPSPDDLKLACAEAVAIVEKFAPGQIELLKGG